MPMTMLHEPTTSERADGLGRRTFLSRAGNAALAVPITTSLIVSAGATPAFAKSPYGGSGDGHKPKSHGHKPRKLKHSVKHRGRRR